jgi:hypothetical protein
MPDWKKKFGFFFDEESFSENIFENFSPSSKKKSNFFSNQAWQFIHQSIALVESSR